LLGYFYTLAKYKGIWNGAFADKNGEFAEKIRLEALFALSLQRIIII